MGIKLFLELIIDVDRVVIFIMKENLLFVIIFVKIFEDE